MIVFSYIFVTRLKCLLRNKQMIFWSLIFPIILATLFKGAFANLSKTEIFKSINIAVVNSQNYERNQGFKTVIKEVSKDGPDKIFNVTYTDHKNAERLLENSKIEGYIYLNPKINLVVKSSGLTQTVIKTFLDNYQQSESTITAIVKENPKAMGPGLIKDVTTYKEYTKGVSPTRGAPNTILNFFYSLIAMACLYGGIFGLKEITDIQGNLSTRAARINLAPVHKMKVFISGILAAFLIHFTNILILLGYVNFILKVDFGNQAPYILLLSFIGCAAGVSLGTMISALVKKNEGTKIAILITTTMIGCFLAGMQYANMKYIVQNNVPILAYLNPATLITDGFYSLYYYNTFERFYMNISILAALSAVFCLVTYMIIRREKYASL